MGIKNNPAFMFWIFFLFFFSFINHLSHGADTISANQSLSGDQTITSAGGNFKLGFYKPGNSSYYYISMWYTKVSTLRIVWVANRDNPISDKYSSVLKILDGNLVILNESQTLIWSTNQNSTTSILWWLFLGMMGI
ncbi:G-type lectin S-receptor-like serine/threonine-protein kinase [Camellia lanceoleosa]|uniref:G-type lectin S-receptor-like serine/threonine-protein kinase n=1 Tax=Camellia lanceoleosa TaxID=1840588 RepID=A0ACC0HCX9_9ERIC|nr:G-type lectin S-receptor-like serine/threonine-protein kinase [Camellia lanceoleosa]